MGSSSSACSNPSVARMATRLLFSLVFIRSDSQFQPRSDARVSATFKAWNELATSNLEAGGEVGVEPDTVPRSRVKLQGSVQAHPPTPLMKEKPKLSAKEMAAALNED